MVLCVVTGVKSPNFVSPANLVNLTNLIGMFGIFSMGLGLIIITGGIDLSVGAVMAFSGIIAANLLQNGVAPALVIPLMLINGAVFGLLIGVLVQYFNVQPFIASLAGMFLARGLAYVFAPRQITVSDAAVLSLNNHKFRSGAWYFTGTVIIAIVVVLIMAWLLARTRFGRTVYAIGGSEQR